MRLVPLFFLLMLASVLTPAFAEELRLEGISYERANPKASSAVVNGQVLTQGETIGDYQITQIFQDKIRMVHQGTGEQKILGLSDGGPSAQVRGPKTEKGAPILDSIGSLIDSLNPFGPSGTYKRFATFLFTGGFGNAANQTAGDTAKRQLETKKMIFMRCRGRYEDRFRGASYSVESSKKTGPGQVSLVVLQKVRGDYFDAVKTSGPVTIPFKHEALMVQTPQGWKVQSFSFRSTAREYYGEPWLCYE